ncbi:transcriptional regulator [Pseudomonas fragi]|uniref:transcriptional regulator n=1 Tax=Pseudomonas fragi TaxID=296 RepID=UPI001F3719BC|nr:transcriptional regulator [Pseudomonas fragi]MCF6759473.1 transcriptional regulator [Pseudomonas fragi]
MKCRLHDEAMAEQFHAYTNYAAELLIEVHHTGDSAELAILLRQMVKAFGLDEGWSLADAERKLSST